MSNEMKSKVPTIQELTDLVKHTRIIQGHLRWVMHMLSAVALVTYCRYEDMSNHIKMCILNMYILNVSITV